jgi:hypothetical protein
MLSLIRIIIHGWKSVLILAYWGIHFQIKQYLNWGLNVFNQIKTVNLSQLYLFIL